MFQRYDLVAAPVVDADDRLVGIITFDDVADVIEEEAEEDIHALGGITTRRRIVGFGVDHRARPFQLVAGQSRHCVSSHLRCLVSSKASCKKWWRLAVLAPIVASQGGNATTQTMTVAVRALATRDLSDANAWRVILRELMVGLLNGIAFAVITGVAAYVWFRVPGLGVRDRACHDLQSGRGRSRRDTHSARL